METKRCYKCGAEKPLSAFYKNKSKPDGLKRECKECCKAYQKAYQKTEQGKAAFAKNAKRYRQTEEGKEAARRGRKKYNKSEKGKAAIKRYRESDKGIATKKRLQAMRRGAEKVSQFTEEDLKAFWLSQNILYDECYYCGKDMNGKYEHLDHYIPIAKGGDHTMVNLRPSCACCNQKKSDKMPTDFPSQR